MSTICVAGNEKMIRCENPSKHSKALEDGNERSFRASPEEFDYWERIQRQRRENMKREYLETGECLLCVIDKSIEGKF